MKLNILIILCGIDQIDKDTFNFCVIKLCFIILIAMHFNLLDRKVIRIEGAGTIHWEEEDTFRRNGIAVIRNADPARYRTAELWITHPQSRGRLWILKGSRHSVKMCRSVTTGWMKISTSPPSHYDGNTTRSGQRECSLLFSVSTYCINLTMEASDLFSLCN